MDGRHTFRLMESWGDDEASAITAPTRVNAEAVTQPPAAREPGIAGVRTYDNRITPRADRSSADQDH